MKQTTPLRPLVFIAALAFERNYVVRPLISFFACLFTEIVIL
jgi:hypothetical protein